LLTLVAAVLVVLALVLRVFAEAPGDNEVCPLSVPVMGVSPLSSSVLRRYGEGEFVLTVPGLRPIAEDAEGELSTVEESLSSTIRVRPAAKTK
jgi:hypothetical protein